MDVIPLGIRPGINNVGLRWYRTIADYPILIRPCQRVDCDDVADFIMAEIYRHRECSFRGDDHVRNVSIDGRRVPPGETTLNRCEVDLLRHLLRRLSLHHLKVTQYLEEGIKLLLCLNEKSQAAAFEEDTSSEVPLTGCVTQSKIFLSNTFDFPYMIAVSVTLSAPPTVHVMGNCTMNESGRVLIVRGSLVGRARQWVDAVKNHLRQKWPDFAVNFNRTILRRVIHTQTLSFDKCLSSHKI